MVKVRSGARAEGLRTAQEALEEAKQINDEYLLSLAMLAFAEALVENNDASQARSVALEAQQRFERRGQEDSEWQAWFIAARASQKLNDSVSARDSAKRAQEVLTTLEQKLGSEAFQRYSSRQDIKNWRKQVEELLSSQ